VGLVQQLEAGETWGEMRQGVGLVQQLEAGGTGGDETRRGIGSTVGGWRDGGR